MSLPRRRESTIADFVDSRFRGNDAARCPLGDIDLYLCNMSKWKPLCHRCNTEGLALLSFDRPIWPRAQRQALL